MIWAIVSDVHGQVAGLRKALDDAAGHEACRVVHLGDLGGYEGLDLLDGLGAVQTFGNWEASSWTRLPEPHRSHVAGWPAGLHMPGFCAAHASPAWPGGLDLAGVVAYLAERDLPWRALFPFLDSSAEARRAACAALTAAGESLFFHGHTHKQEAWHVWPDGREEVFRPYPSDGSAQPTLPVPAEGSLLVGVGSVGNPLHGSGACYALYDDEARVVTWRQV